MVLGPALLGAGGRAYAACRDWTPDVSNNLSLECLIGPRPPKASYEPTLREQTMYRSLLSELSAVMTLPVMDPADTVGYSGFHFSFDVAATTVKADPAKPNWWTGYPQNDGSHAEAGARHLSGTVLPVATLMLRKGIWMPLPPLPSVELGLGASNLLQSDIYALNGYFKFTLHEGYHDIPFPSVAARASVSRIAGASQVDLTIITVEGQLSKAFGVGGTFTLEPYLGGGAIFSIARSQVIDTNPTVDLYRGPAPSTGITMTDSLAQKVVFPTQDNIIRWRLFAGINLHYAIISLTIYYSYFGVGADNGQAVPAVNAPSTGGAKPLDLAAEQHQFGGSVGLRF
jgi:hypothetical protein